MKQQLLKQLLEAQASVKAAMLEETNKFLVAGGKFVDYQDHMTKLPISKVDQAVYAALEFTKQMED